MTFRSVKLYCVALSLSVPPLLLATTGASKSLLLKHEGLVIGLITIFSLAYSLQRMDNPAVPHLASFLFAVGEGVSG